VPTVPLHITLLEKFLSCRSSLAACVLSWSRCTEDRRKRTHLRAASYRIPLRQAVHGQSYSSREDHLISFRFFFDEARSACFLRGGCAGTHLLQIFCSCRRDGKGKQERRRVYYRFNEFNSPGNGMLQCQIDVRENV